MLNDREMRALAIYCNRYRIKNKSEFLRETIMKAILKRFEDEHPSLWEEPEMTLFNQNEYKIKFDLIRGFSIFTLRRRYFSLSYFSFKMFLIRTRAECILRNII